jgi:hypothetical protein
MGVVNPPPSKSEGQSRHDDPRKSFVNWALNRKNAGTEQHVMSLASQRLAMGRQVPMDVVSGEDQGEKQEGDLEGRIVDMLGM